LEHSSSTQGTGISAVKSVTYGAVQTATNCTSQSVHFGNKRKRIFLSFPFLVAERKIKSQLRPVFGFSFGFGFALTSISPAQ
jgi:hypothetical protein